MRQNSNLSKKIRTYRNLLTKAEKSGEKVSLWDYEFSINKLYQESGDIYIIVHEGVVNRIENTLSPSSRHFNTLEMAESILSGVLITWISNLASFLNKKVISTDTSVGKYDVKVLSDLELKKVINSL